MSSYSHALVIVPVFNEEDHIGNVVNELREIGFNNILVVDDGSKDRTSSVARKAGATVLVHPINRGPGAATQTGFEYAMRHPEFKYVITMDGDGQHHVKDAITLLGKLEDSGADIVIGNRFLLGTNYIPRSRVIFNGIANLVTYFFSWGWVSDSQSGFKAIRQEALPKLKLYLDGYEFCSEIIIKARAHRLKLLEAPIKVHYSKLTMKKGQGLITGIRTFVNLFYSLLFRHSGK